MMRGLLFTLFLLLSLLVKAEEIPKITVSGYIRDAVTGEYLMGATVYDKDFTVGVATNSYGFYSLTLPKGNQSLVYAFVGYAPVELELSLNKNLQQNVKLHSLDVELDEVVISSTRRDQNITSVQMSVEKLEMSQLEKLPVLFGEKDILKTIQLLPGVSTVSEGGNGFSVRGGAVDQNLILLDEAPIYSASHLMGFFSIFNADVLKNVEVYKGGIPARFGGRASSVLDVMMRDGNSHKYSASGGIGLISSRLALEGPIVNDKASFIVSGRRSYADLMAKAGGILEKGARLYFYDLNAKVNYRINDANRLYLSGYFGQDDFGYEQVGMNWGNSTASLRWNHLITNKFFSNTTFIFSNYSYGFGVADAIDMRSGIVDYGFKQDFSVFLNPLNTFRFGLTSTYHIFNPGQLHFADSNNQELVLEKKKALESALYFSNEQKVSSQILLDYGVRFSTLHQMGEGLVNEYDDDNNIVNAQFYKKGELIKRYMGIEPRAAVNFILSPNSSIKGSYNRMAQYLHLMSNSTSGQPTDTWMPSSYNIKPLWVNQIALGYFRNFLDNRYEFSFEVYHKNLNNVTDYKDGADILLNEHIESYVLQGEGRSNGAEFYFKKTEGKITGWVSYTLLKSENKIPGINQDKWYSSKLDKRHDLSVVGSWEISPRTSFSATWVYFTGNAVTFPSGKYEFNGTLRPYYTERNGYRMEDYHRLDLNFHWVTSRSKKFESSWDFSLYNAYNQRNAYSISFRENEENPNITEAVKLSLFGIVPSATWNFKF